MCIEIFLFKICRIYREKEMTLPKGYKPNTPSREDDDRPTSRPRRNNRGWGRAILSFIFFVIFLILTIHFAIQYMEESKELDEQKKIVEVTKKDFEKTFKDIYGRLPYPSEYPH